MFFGRFSIAMLTLSSFAAAATNVRAGRRARSLQEKEEHARYARALLEDKLIQSSIQDLSLVNTAAKIPLSDYGQLTFLQTEQASQCEEVSYFTQTTSFNNPEPLVLDSGTTVFIFPLYETGKTEPVGVYGDFAEDIVLDDGSCFHHSIYLIGEDAVNAFDYCDGTGFDLYDQIILGGLGKWECSSGFVFRSEGETEVKFDLSFCQDPQYCPSS